MLAHIFAKWDGEDSSRYLDIVYPFLQYYYFSIIQRLLRIMLQHSRAWCVSRWRFWRSRCYRCRVVWAAIRTESRQHLRRCSCATIHTWHMRKTQTAADMGQTRAWKSRPFCDHKVFFSHTAVWTKVQRFRKSESLVNFVASLQCARNNKCCIFVHDSL